MAAQPVPPSESSAALRPSRLGTSPREWSERDLGLGLTAKVQQQLDEQTQLLRGVLAEELGDLRHVVRGEVEAALKSWGDQPDKFASKPTVEAPDGGRPNQRRRRRREGSIVPAPSASCPPESRWADARDPDRSASAEGLPHSVVPIAGGLNDPCINDLLATPASTTDPGTNDLLATPESTTDTRINDLMKRESSLDTYGFSCLMNSIGGWEVVQRSERSNMCDRDPRWGGLVGKVLALWTWLHELEEPPRKGCLARLVESQEFEVTACLVIFLDFVFMARAANFEIQNPNKTDTSVLIGNRFFLAFFTVELLLKLLVHRQWFVFNAYWKANMFDFILVLLGFISMFSGTGSAGPLRLLRLLKFGKAIRAARVMSHLSHLRALLVCLQGSLISLFWSVLMLVLVYLIFSLFLMQIIAGHLQETGEALEESIFYEPFGSVGTSVLTLHRASTDSWQHAHDVISVTGDLGRAIFLFFIVFVQFALMNIITGIFVESAMLTLSPDSEVMAQEHHRQERENILKLEQLCSQVDADCSGTLTQDEFEHALRKKHIPMMLTMLGLNRHHVLEFFIHMAKASDGQVEIDRFVQGCMRLKGAATQFDLLKMKSELRDQQAGHDQRLSEMLELLRGRLEDRAGLPGA